MTYRGDVHAHSAPPPDSGAPIRGERPRVAPVTETLRYQPGDQLSNGATVTASESGPVGEVLLCRWNRPGRPEQWVTWIVSRSGQTVDGRYFEDSSPAARNFRLRVAGRG